MAVTPFGGRKKNGQCVFFFFFFANISGGGESGVRCAAARLGYRLCQGYKQAVIRLPNRIILPVSAPKHMGPHKAAAVHDRHPLLITQRRGAEPFSTGFSIFSWSFLRVWQPRKCTDFLCMGERMENRKQDRGRKHICHGK